MPCSLWILLIAVPWFALDSSVCASHEPRACPNLPPPPACPLQVLVTATRNQAIDAVVSKLARVEGSILVID